MKQLDSLRKVRSLLSASGATGLTTRSAGPLGLNEYRLAFLSKGLIPFGSPLTDASDFSMVYNERKNLWSFSGYMYGVTPPEATNDPRAWLSTVAVTTRSREAAYRSALLYTQAFWERYKGDLEHFTYNLGVQLAPSGVMTRIDENHYRWQHQMNPDVALYFSNDPNELVPFGGYKNARLGFVQPDMFHTYSMDMSSLQRLQGDIQATSQRLAAACAEISACFA